MSGYMVFLALSIALSGEANALAICVQSPPPCESLKRSSHVFIADVDSVVAGEVTFRVVEAFKGLSRNQLEFRTPLEPLNEESTSFIPERRYLVYGTAAPDGFHTTCTRTREVLQAGPPMNQWLPSELRDLRRCR